MRARLFMSCMALAMTAAARPQTGGIAPPSSLQGLARCTTITDNAQRLACYDQAAAALVAAEQRSDIIVVERQQLEQARRAMFGFSLPDLPLLRGHGKVATIDQIDGVLASASADSSAQWLFRLRDGSEWQQVDINPLTIDPRAGDPVVVRRAGLGGYRLSVARAPGVRVRRVH